MNTYTKPVCKELDNLNTLGFVFAQTGVINLTQENDPCSTVSDPFGSALTSVFNFPINSTPSEQGVLNVTICGDIDEDFEEHIITVEDITLSPLLGGNDMDCSCVSFSYALSDFFSLNEFQLAAADGTIQVTVQPEPCSGDCDGDGATTSDVQCFCGPGDPEGGEADRVEVQLIINDV